MTSSPPFLPYGRQSVDDDDIAAVVNVLRGDWLTQGPTVTEFETRLAATVEAREAISCSSGTAALHLACLTLDLTRADAVVVPALTFLATANAPHHAGGTVVFADVDPTTGLMTVETAAAAADRARRAGLRPRALLPVHFAGQTCDMPGLAALAASLDAVVIEDACHAIGGATTHGGRETPIGACDHGIMTVFSFHPVKTIAAGEGGAITTNAPRLADRARRLRNHGIERDPRAFEDAAEGFTAGIPNPWYYEMREPGFNYRLSDLHAALATSQLRRLDAFTARRRALMARYAERLASHHPAIRPPHPVPWCRPAWHLCAALIDFTALKTTRLAVMSALREGGVGSQVHYFPVHRQPFWRERAPSPPLPGADSHYARLLSLPLFPAMDDGDVDRVVDTLLKAVGVG